MLALLVEKLKGIVGYTSSLGPGNGRSSKFEASRVQKKAHTEKSGFTVSGFRVYGVECFFSSFRV